MGLPRSNLVKPSATAPIAFAPVVAAPVASTPTPELIVELAPPSSDMSRATDPEIDIDVPIDSVSTPVILTPPPTRTALPSLVEPSPQALLERAASLGPARATWESLVDPDPILRAKGEPDIALRRARLTRVVKVTLGACVGVCVLALGLSVVSGPTAAASTRAVAKTLPTEAVTPVEKLVVETPRTKAAPPTRQTAAAHGAKLPKRR